PQGSSASWANGSCSCRSPRSSTSRSRSSRRRQHEAPLVGADLRTRGQGVACDAVEGDAGFAGVAVRTSPLVRLRRRPGTHAERCGVSRENGRRPNELRQVVADPQFLEQPHGVVLWSQGRTRVLCTASVTEGVPRWLYKSGRGWLTAEYSLL